MRFGRQNTRRSRSRWLMWNLQWLPSKLPSVLPAAANMANGYLLFPYFLISSALLTSAPCQVLCKQHVPQMISSHEKTWSGFSISDQTLIDGNPCTQSVDAGAAASPGSLLDPQAPLQTYWIRICIFNMTSRWLVCGFKFEKTCYIAITELLAIAITVCHLCESFSALMEDEKKIYKEKDINGSWENGGST